MSCTVEYFSQNTITNGFDLVTYQSSEDDLDLWARALEVAEHKNPQFKCFEILDKPYDQGGDALAVTLFRVGIKGVKVNGETII